MRKIKKETVITVTILALFILGLIGLLTFPLMTDSLISTTSVNDFKIEYKGEVELIMPNWMGTTTELGNYSFADDNVTVVKLRNPSYLLFD